MARRVKGNYSGKQDLRNYADALRRYRKCRVDLMKMKANGDAEAMREYELLADDVELTYDLWQEWQGWFNRHSKRVKMGNVVIYTRV